jgi:hypothetical protein
VRSSAATRYRESGSERRATLKRSAAITITIGCFDAERAMHDVADVK